MITGKKETSGTGSSRAESASATKTLSRAISEVISCAQALSSGRAVSRSRAKSVSRGESGSQAESQGRALAQGLSEVHSLIESVGASVTRSVARSKARTVTEAQSRSTGQTRSQSVGSGQAVSERTVYYSVEEEMIVRANELSCLPPRTAYVVMNGERTETVLIRTYDMPQQWQTRLGGKCFLAEFLERSRGRALPPPSNLDLVPRVQSELRRGK